MGFCACVVYKVCHFSICNLFVLTHNNSRSIHEKKNNNSFLNLQFKKNFFFSISPTLLVILNLKATLTPNI